MSQRWILSCWDRDRRRVRFVRAGDAGGGPSFRRCRGAADESRESRRRPDGRSRTQRETGDRKVSSGGAALRERVLDRHGERDRRRLYVAGLRSSAPRRDRPPLRKRSVPRSRNADFVGLAGLRNHNGHVIVLRNSARVLGDGVQAGRAAPTRSSRARESLPSETTLASHHV